MKFNPAFKLNGQPTSADDLKQTAHRHLEAQKLNSWELAIWQFICEWLNPETDSIRMTTSGSTGEPKQISLSKAAMIASAERSLKYFSLNPGDSALLILPAAFIGGKMMIVRALCGGLNLCWVRPSLHALSRPSKNRWHFAAATPLQVQKLVDTEPDSWKQRLHAIENLLIGGAAIGSTLKKYIVNSGCAAYQSYGMTESCSHIALRKIESDDLPYQLLEGVEASEDDRNCLIFHDKLTGIGPLATNDSVHFVDDGQFYILGRIDEVINSGGLKIHSSQIEAQLAASIDQPYFITSMAEPVLGQMVVLVVERDPAQLSEEHVTQFRLLCGPLKAAKPRKLFCLDAFKYLPSGKVNKKATLEAALLNSSGIDL